MKIALCHESVLPQRGGCETYVASLAHRLVADGHEVHLYARRWDPTALPAGLIYHPVEVSARVRVWRQWGFSRAVARLLRQSNQDISIGFDKVAGVDVLYPQAGVHEMAIEASLRKYRSPLLRGIVRAVRWLDPAEWSFWALERSACRRHSTSVIAISRMVAEHLRLAYGIEPTRLHTLPIAALPQRFDPLDRPRRRFEARHRWGLIPGRPVGLFAAMNFRLKGLEPLLRALARVKEPLDLLAVGRKCAGAFSHLARQLGIQERVRFVGFCPDVRDAYFAADFLVHPTFYDPCSNVVLEALACGLPVITTRYNGAAELLGGTGTQRAEGLVLDDPHDSEALAAALTIMTDTRQRDQFATAARLAGQRWTFEDHYRGLVAILQAHQTGRTLTAPPSAVALG
ncbi:MAG: glycosyltransferase family 4 protein [Gemmataceae bacterium]